MEKTLFYDKNDLIVSESKCRCSRTRNIDKALLKIGEFINGNKHPESVPKTK